MKNQIKGILLIVILSLAAIFISDGISQIVKFEALTVGIILGILTKSLLKDLSDYHRIINFSAKKLLKIGIVLLGFKVNFNTLLQLGIPAILGVAVFIIFVLSLASFLGKRMGVSSKLSTLIGVGSSICGASAIVTIAPVIQAEEDDAVLAVSIVSFLGTIGVLVYSAIALMPWLSDMEFGVFSGLTLHGVGHALAAAFARGESAGEMGTIIKMTRVLFLVPMAMILGNKHGDHKSKRVKFPVYVLLFILMAIVNTTGILPSTWTKYLGKLSSYAILASMVAMGLKVNFSDLKRSGIKVSRLGITLFAITAVMILTLILVF